MGAGLALSARKKDEFDAAVAHLAEQGIEAAPYVCDMGKRATKHGVVGLTRQFAAEWGEHGITVNAICPGFFPSRMTRGTLDPLGTMLAELTPTKRLGDEEDLKGLAVLLASEAWRHITGRAIAVDGGAGLI